MRGSTRNAFKSLCQKSIVVSRWKLGTTYVFSKIIAVLNPYWIWTLLAAVQSKACYCWMKAFLLVVSEAPYTLAQCPAGNARVNRLTWQELCSYIMAYQDTFVVDVPEIKKKGANANNGYLLRKSAGNYSTDMQKAQICKWALLCALFYDMKGIQTILSDITFIVTPEANYQSWRRYLCVQHQVSIVVRIWNWMKGKHCIWGHQKLPNDTFLFLAESAQVS